MQGVFDSNWIGKGAHVANFEENFSRHLKGGRKSFLSTSSCTEALFLAPKLFGLGSGDEIIAPSISFVAIGSAILDSGATLVIADVDPRSLNIRAQDIAEKITPRTRMVMLTHFGGFSCDLDPILELCAEKNIVVVEDSACALRAFYKGKACGTLGDMGMWSFDAMKTVCTGDGGMIYLKSAEKLLEATEGLYLGLPARQKSGTDSADAADGEWWKYEVNRFGRRSIMNNIAGAIGNVQLTRLDGFLARRRVIFDTYMAELSGIEELNLPPVPQFEQTPSHYFFWLQTAKRNELAKFLLEHKVYTTFRYWPLHKIAGFGMQESAFPNAEYAASHTLNIPLHHSLPDSDVERIVGLIKQFFQRA